MSTQCTISWSSKGLLFSIVWVALVDYSQQQFGDFNDFEDFVGGDTGPFPPQPGLASFGVDLDTQQLQQGQQSQTAPQPQFGTQFGQQSQLGGQPLFGQQNQFGQVGPQSLFGQQFGGQQQFGQPPQPNNQLVFSGSNTPRPPAGSSSLFRFTTPQPFTSNNNNNQLPNLNQNLNQNQNGAFVFVNNRPTVATMAPFMASTTPSPAYMNCFNTCPTTSEYNPICGSDQQLYQNEQKFNCAVRCGAAIQIVRRGSCMGLFPMTRG